jgi:phage terminase large subunit
MILSRSPAAIRRQAEDYLRSASVVSSLPLVVWQNVGEPLADFDQRMTALRRRTTSLILAVQSGRRTAPALPGIRQVELQPDLFVNFHPAIPARYRAASGGRGSAKSWTVATVILLHALTRPIRILCCREIQLSLRQSVHRLLADTITRLGLDAYFDVGANSITSRAGATILFEGLLMNASKLRSLEGVGLAWVEEAESVSDRSLEILIPTVRQPSSELWFSMNPSDDGAPAYERFVLSPPPDCRHCHVTYESNPWLPEVLLREAAYLRSVDLDAFEHVWLGHTRKISEAVVFRGKVVVEEFEPAAGWSPFYGVDWGFSQDPTTMIKTWVHERTLYVEHEAYGHGVDLDQLPKLFDTVPGCRAHVVRCDNARPETISFMQQRGFPLMRAADKWSGSIEDGVAFLRSFERIVVHPRCTHTIEEMRLYSYKVDKLSGDPLPDLIDRHNHCIDAIRYSVSTLIRRQGGEGLMQFMAQQYVATQEQQRDRQSMPGVKISPVSFTGWPAP